MELSTEISNNKKWITKVNSYLLLVISFLFPIYQKIIPILLFTWFITSLFLIEYKTYFSSVKNKIGVLVMTLFFVIHLFSLFYSNNLKSGFFDIEVKLTFLLLPLVMPFISNKSEFKFKSILLSFIAGNSIASLICLGHSFFLLFAYNASFQYFTYTDLSILMAHPTYFAIYICFSIASAVYLLKKKEITNSKLKISLYITIPFLFMMVYLLSSKAGLIALLLLMIVWAIPFIKKNLYSKIIATVIFFLITVVILKNDRFSVLPATIKEIFSSNKKTQAVDVNESTNERIVIWRSSIHIIKENLFFGVGTGDVKDELINNYKKINFRLGVERKFNAHNQFIETTIGLGLIGLISLLLIFLTLTKLGIQESDILKIGFVVILFINLLFESVLNTQAGVLFFTFFYSVLISKNGNQFLKR